MSAVFVCGIRIFMAKPNRIFLIGPMGAGKTTIGKQLAQSLGMAFNDSDQEIQRRTGVDIPFIFEKEGEEARPVGIITDRDIVIEVVAQNINPDSLFVKDVMSTDPVSVPEAVSLLETLGLMKQQGVRRMLVVDDAGSLQGLLSADDAIELIAEQMNDLTRLVNREITHEQARHP